MTKRDALRVVCHGLALWFMGIGLLGGVRAAFETSAMSIARGDSGSMPAFVVAFSYPVAAILIAVYLWFSAAKLSSVLDDTTTEMQPLTAQAVQRVLLCAMGVFFLTQAIASIVAFILYLLRGVFIDNDFMNYITEGRFSWYAVSTEVTRALIGLFLIFGPAWPKNTARTIGNALWRIPSEEQIREAERRGDDEPR